MPQGRGGHSYLAYAKMEARLTEMRNDEEPVHISHVLRERKR